MNMDYEQKYKDALERMKSWVRGEHPECFSEAQKTAEFIFPELKLESEDEKIRKVLLNDFKNHCSEYYCEGINRDMIIAWLEKQKEPKDKGEISDGYHTFNELYRYRMLYNAAFFNLLPKELVHKSKKHHDGKECFGGGWFIVMANLPTGQISNHYELKDWDLFQVPEKYTADEWDGHTPQEAADRLHKYLLEKQGEQSSLPKWKYKKDDTPLLRDSLILNKYGCVLKAPSGAIISNAWVLDYAELAELPREEPEKQDEQKPYGQRKECFDCQFNEVGTCRGYCQMKRDEQKTPDKVDPKFKVGDWVVWVNKISCHIDNIYKAKKFLMYTITDTNNMTRSCSVKGFDNNAHLWTIQDAKDGDVLIKEGTEEPFIYNGNRGTYMPEFVGGYCGIRDGEFTSNGSTYYWGRPGCPATKEQRDFLFSKMKEAGYEWDSEKKEPKKIEQKKQDTSINKENI